MPSSQVNGKSTPHHASREVTPQRAAALRATRLLWESIEHEFGLLTEVPKPAITDICETIALKRGNTFVYPGFQFDPASGRVRQVVPALKAMARRAGWDEEDLVLWLCTPSRYFSDERPVDHLDDNDLVRKGQAHARIQW